MIHTGDDGYRQCDAAYDQYEGALKYPGLSLPQKRTSHQHHLEVDNHGNNVEYTFHSLPAGGYWPPAVPSERLQSGRSAAVAASRDVLGDEALGLVADDAGQHLTSKELVPQLFSLRPHCRNIFQRPCRVDQGMETVFQFG